MRIVLIVLFRQGFMALTTQCFRQPELMLSMLELKNGNDIALSYRKPLYEKSNWRPQHIVTVHSSLSKFSQFDAGGRIQLGSVNQQDKRVF